MAKATLDAASLAENYFNDQQAVRLREERIDEKIITVFKGNYVNNAVNNPEAVKFLEKFYGVTVN